MACEFRPHDPHELRAPFRLKFVQALHTTVRYIGAKKLRQKIPVHGLRAKIGAAKGAAHHRISGSDFQMICEANGPELVNAAELVLHLASQDVGILREEFTERTASDDVRVVANLQILAQSCQLCGMHLRRPEVCRYPAVSKNLAAQVSQPVLCFQRPDGAHFATKDNLPIRADQVGSRDGRVQEDAIVEVQEILGQIRNYP